MIASNTDRLAHVLSLQIAQGGSRGIAMTLHKKWYGLHAAASLDCSVALVNGSAASIEPTAASVQSLRTLTEISLDQVQSIGVALCRYPVPCLRLDSQLCTHGRCQLCESLFLLHLLLN